MNSRDIFPGTSCCPEGGGGESVMTLIIIVGVFLLGLALMKWIKRTGNMKKFKNVAVIIILLGAVAAVVAVKHLRKQEGCIAGACVSQTNPVAQASGTEQKAVLPRLVDLGADKCIPCKMMAPILEEMKTTYAGQLDVEFIDVWQNQAAGQEYGIRVIPTQIFFSADGKELFRHEGFFAKEDMLAKWKEFGVELNAPTNGESNE